MAEIYQLPENGNSGNANIPFSIPIGFGGMGNNGFGFGTGGWGNQSQGIDYLKKTLEENDFETADTEIKAE